MNRSRLLVTLFLSATLLPAVPAQQQYPDRIAGTVRSAADGHPLAHADVTLHVTASNKTAAETTTDDDGRFQFSAVPAGKYRLTGTATGYLSASFLEHDGFSTAIVTGAGLDTTALALRLEPKAAITGRITDESGDPVAMASVALFREEPSAAKPVVRVSTRTTGDTGTYEFADLASGNYFVAVTARPWYAVNPAPDAPGANLPYETAVDPALNVAYPMVFYPHALDSAGASPIPVKAGEEVTADLQLTPEHAVMLQLPPADPDHPNQRFFQLSREVFGDREPVVGVGGNQGWITGVVPGQYLLDEHVMGSGPGQRTGSILPASTRPIDLTSGSTSLAAFAPSPLADFEATVHMANGAPVPSSLVLNLQPVGQPYLSTGRAVVDGEVQLDGVPPGEYRVTATAEGRTLDLVSLAVNGKPSPDRHLHIAGAGTLTADLVVSADATRLTGFARREGKPDPGAMILLVPAGPSTDDDLFRRDQSDLDGSFTLPNVPPGHYLLLAIDDGWNLRWRDPATLAPYLLHAVPVAVPPGATATTRVSETVTAQPR